MEHGDDVLELEGFPPLRLSVRHFNLMNSMLNVLNTARHDDPDSVLACYFLEHFDCLAELNIYDVAEACYTSRSSIRRFCQSIGFENFSALKARAWEWETHRRFFVGYADRAEFKRRLVADIDAMMESINANVDDDDLDGLASCINRAHNILLVASDFSSMAMREFQQSMLFMHKTVRILTDSCGDEDILTSLDPRDLIIVVSASGNYARAARRQICEACACKVLVTLNRDEELAEPYDAAIYLADEDYYGTRTVYAKYGINYFFDVLYNRYLMRYRRDLSQQR